MFDIDKWQEIFATLQKNRLRTFLTSFSIAWGILMLIILLGAGNGLQNAVMRNFENNATNVIWISGGKTSMSHNGLGEGRRIQFTNETYEIIRDQVQGLDHISPMFNIWGGTQVSYKKEYGNFNIQCILPDHKPIESAYVIKGRYINDIDIKKKRKVCIIGERLVKILFKENEPVGEYVKVNGIPFKVVGIFGDADPSETKRVVLPFSAAQQIFNGGVRVSNIGVTTGDASVEESKKIEEKIREKIAAVHSFNKEDKSAVRMYNTLDGYEQTMKVFSGIKMFIWFIGIGTLIAGIVGISNIMLIVVKDRTREIGVRKAIGATPFSVVSLIISEAVFITTLAGYFGMVLGIAIMEGVDYIVDQAIANQAETTDAAGQMVVFMNPNADIGIAIGATILLVVSGALAGMIPAIKASKIKPIEALRYE